MRVIHITKQAVQFELLTRSGAPIDANSGRLGLLLRQSLPRGKVFVRVVSLSLLAHVLLSQLRCLAALGSLLGDPRWRLTLRNVVRLIQDKLLAGPHSFNLFVAIAAEALEHDHVQDVFVHFGIDSTKLL